MALTAMLFTIAAFLALFVSAMPSFEGVTSWSSINSLVPGMSQLQGLGPIATQNEAGSFPYYMSIAAPRGKRARPPSDRLVATHPAHAPCPMQVSRGT